MNSTISPISKVINNGKILSFSPVNRNINSKNLFITFNANNSKKINEVVETSSCNFSSFLNRKNSKNDNNTKLNKKGGVNYNINKNKLIKNHQQNKICTYISRPEKIEYIHYPNKYKQNYEYSHHSPNFNNNSNFYNQTEDKLKNFIEKRNNLIKERISRSLSIDKDKKDLRKLILLRNFTFPKNHIQKKDFNFDNNCNFTYNKLQELSKEKSNEIICNIRNAFHNHDKNLSKSFFKKAAYEKDPKNISFLSFKINPDKTKEIKHLNFMDSHNKIKSQQNLLLMDKNSIYNINGNCNKNLNNEDSPEFTSFLKNNNDSHIDHITCKIINDSEIVIKWLKSLKIKDVEKLQFFDDSYKDNTKYIKNQIKESILCEIKNG